MNTIKFIQNKKTEKQNKIIILVKLKDSLLYVIIIILIINIFAYNLLFNKKINFKLMINEQNNIIIKLKNDLLNQFKNLESIIKNKDNLNGNSKINDFEGKEFDENINKRLIENQKHFCKNNDLFLDQDIENNIKSVKIHLYNISYYMYVYKNNDIVSKSIIDKGSWEGYSTNKLLESLNYYSEKNKLSKNEITILDIGANIGWYSFYLGKAGYKIISFEVSHINNYILKKNYCLNNDINITIINKGIGLEEEKCLLHHPPSNVGNAVILCGENANIANKKEMLTEEVKFTKLKNYISFLTKINLALIKMDIEGSEGKAIISGIELISKYHIPFLFIEFNQNYLKMQGTEPKQFLEIFEKNGYKFCKNDFFCKTYLSMDELLKLSTTNLYIIYSKFL